jgi:hypothetical protein
MPKDSTKPENGCTHDEKLPSSELVDSEQACSSTSDTVSTPSNHNNDVHGQGNDDKKKALLYDLQRASAELEKTLNKDKEIKNKDENKEDEKSHASKSRESNTDSQYSHLISTLSDVKADMTKMLRIIHALDKQTNSTKTRTDFLKNEIDQIRKTVDRGQGTDRDAKLCEVDGRSSDTISVCDVQSNDSLCSTQTVKTTHTGKSTISDQSLNSNFSHVTAQTLDSNSSQASCGTKDTSRSAQTQTSCSYDEFHKFKTEVLHMLHDLAKQVNDQMGMLANIMSTIAVSRKPMARHN